MFAFPHRHSIGLQVEKLAADDNDEKIAAIAALVAEGDPQAAAILRQAAEGEIVLDGKKVEIVANNRVRGRIAEALSVLKLLSANPGERLEAARALAGGADAAMLPLILKAKEKETDAEIKSLLEMTAAGTQIKSEDKATRLAAAIRDVLYLTGFGSCCYESDDDRADGCRVA